MVHSSTQTRLFCFDDQSCSNAELMMLAAKKLQVFHYHRAGKGSKYITIGDILIRFSDHENTSAFHGSPDYNIINRDISKEELMEIDSKIEYSERCKQKAFALHVGLTIPKLKKILPPDLYEDIAEDPYYYNTLTKFIKVSETLKLLSELGYENRRPVIQEKYSYEDYSGY